jgi:hypothetical protein
MLSTTRFVYRLAVKRSPDFCLVESMESIMRIKMRVPAGTVIFFELCAAAEAAVAGAVLATAATLLAKEFPCMDTIPNRMATAQTDTVRICFLSLVAFTIIPPQSAEKKPSEDQ